MHAHRLTSAELATSTALLSRPQWRATAMARSCRLSRSGPPCSPQPAAAAALSQHTGAWVLHYSRCCWQTPDLQSCAICISWQGLSVLLPCRPTPEATYSIQAVWWWWWCCCSLHRGQLSVQAVTHDTGTGWQHMWVSLLFVAHHVVYAVRQSCQLTPTVARLLCCAARLLPVLQPADDVSYNAADVLHKHSTPAAAPTTQRTCTQQTRRTLAAVAVLVLQQLCACPCVGASVAPGHDDQAPPTTGPGAAP